MSTRIQAAHTELLDILHEHLPSQTRGRARVLLNRIHSEVRSQRKLLAEGEAPAHAAGDPRMQRGLVIHELELPSQSPLRTLVTS